MPDPVPTGVTWHPKPQGRALQRPTKRKRTLEAAESLGQDIRGVLANQAEWRPSLSVVVEAACRANEPPGWARQREASALTAGPVEQSTLPQRLACAWPSC